uniref:protein FAR1-RELATED SEQUENCE 5-like n=1 Tax=Erigeron canadensis TaxID=72917 RepID=UPI001CB99D6C|nr:protein FAR1-RELATED SEQUENCE 5-like [Erigeron canadensis]
MHLDNIPRNELVETPLIDDIDANGYLVNSVDLETECNSQNVDVDLGTGEYLDSYEDGNTFNDDNIIGRVFNTHEDAYTFYNQYAFLHGFGIRIHWDYKNKTTNEKYQKLFVCNKVGFKKVKDHGSSGDSKKSRRETRTGCDAQLRVSKTKDGKWRVDKFIDAYNHELSTTPQKVMKHRSHSKFHRSMAWRSLMLNLGQSGLRPSKIKKAVNAIKSPFEIEVTSKQCVDVLSQQRKQYKGKEFYGLIKHLQDKSKRDLNQYFEIDLFADGSPRNIFWADGRSRDAYLKFGDVVVFDVTYMTHRFRLPFAPFVRVNHHGQSILFGGALLENEKEETFQWLFEHFLKCMFNKYPAAIITDQDKAIGNAICKVFPNTRHRYCVWHINRHELEHLNQFASRFSDFQESYKQWVKSDTTEEFETQWEVINSKYNLDSSNWMVEMYKLRNFWVEAFFKDIFLAGMTTSQRSESILSYFDGYVNSNTMLNEFVIQYDKAVDDRRVAEEDEDFQTINTLPVLSSVHPIEAKASEVYTRKIFEVFKKEWIEATNNLTHETLSKSMEESSYKVGQLNVDKKYWRTVKFCFLNKVDARCSCALFETHGILCKHILYVMKKKNVETLPDHYILPRWTIASRYRAGSVSIKDPNSENEVSALTLWCVHNNYTKAVDQARDSPNEINRLNAFFLKFLEEQMKRKKPTMLENKNKDSNGVQKRQPELSLL